MGHAVSASVTECPTPGEADRRSTCASSDPVTACDPCDGVGIDPFTRCGAPRVGEHHGASPSRALWVVTGPLLVWHGLTLGVPQVVAVQFLEFLDVGVVEPASGDQSVPTTPSFDDRVLKPSFIEVGVIENDDL
jgi:hypothetical protein